MAITEYVADTSHWKRWQKEYTYGVLLIIPPDPPLSGVNELRQRYAWSQSSECDAHISLTAPLPRPLSQADWRELETLAAAVPAFDIHYGPLRHYLPHPGVCLSIQPQDRLASLLAAMESASCFAGVAPRRYPFSPHMTIAEMITVEQTHAIMRELSGVTPEGDFLCSAVSYLVPDAQFRFTERGRLHLAPSV